MRGLRRSGRATCAPWGFAVSRYTPRGLDAARADAWPPRKRKGANKGVNCWSAEGQMWI